MDFKDIIKTKRKELNKTLEEVAKECDVSKATVLRWESGEIKNVRRDKIIKLANSLHIPPSKLMGWDNQSQSETTNVKEDNQQFTSVDEAMLFLIKSPVVSAYGGYDLDKMSDDEIVDFANELSSLFKVIAERRKK